MRNQRLRGEATTPQSALPTNATATRVVLHQGIKGRASWDLVAQEILEVSEDWIASRCQDFDVPGLSVNLGFRQDGHFMMNHCLQDYAVAIADRIKELCGIQFVGLRLTKRKSDLTILGVEQVSNVPPAAELQGVTLETRRSYATPAFEEEVRIGTAPMRNLLVQRAPLKLRVSYVTGLPRTWSRLWKPTIAGVFPDQSGRHGTESSQVVDMGFHHRSVGEELGHGVRLTISAGRQPAPGAA